MDAQILGHLVHEPVHDQTAGHGIICRPVMLEVRQTQGIGHNVQLEFIQLGQHVLGKNQGVCRREMIGNIHSAAGSPDKAGVEIRIVSNQYPISHKFQEFGKYLLDLRGTHQHIIGNARKLNDFFVQSPLGIHKGLKTVQFLTVLHNHRADFDDPVILCA